jgi:hypothetical protein
MRTCFHNKNKQTNKQTNKLQLFRPTVSSRKSSEGRSDLKKRRLHRAAGIQLLAASNYYNITITFIHETEEYVTDQINLHVRRQLDTDSAVREMATSSSAGERR